MWTRMVDWLIAGPAWVWKCLIVVFGATLVFSVAPAIVAFPEMQLPPAYELKSKSPLADTTKLTVPEHPGERSHGAKLTPRVVSSVSLFIATQLSLHPYWPASIGGLLFLCSGLVVGRRLTGDRLVGLLTGLLFAGLYASNACFARNWEPKPFDGVALGAVALTAMLVNRPWLFGISAFLACFTDERAILSLGVLGLMCWFMESLDNRQRVTRCVTLGIALAAFVIARLGMTLAMQWGSSDFSMLGDSLIGGVLFGQLLAWSALEGGWIPVALAGRKLYRDGAIWELLIFAMFLLGFFVSCILVLDLSRAGSYAFPFVFVGLAILSRGGTKVTHLRLITAAGACVSLIAVNFEIITGRPPQFLLSSLLALILRWAQGG